MKNNNVDKSFNTTKKNTYITPLEPGTLLTVFTTMELDHNRWSLLL